MALHQPGIANPVGAICRVHTHATLGFLEGDGEDEATVEQGRFGDAVDGVEELVGFLRTVVRYSPVVVTARIHDYFAIKFLPIDIGQH